MHPYSRYMFFNRLKRIPLSLGQYNYYFVAQINQQLVTLNVGFTVPVT